MRRVCNNADSIGRNDLYMVAGHGAFGYNWGNRGCHPGQYNHVFCYWGNRRMQHYGCYYSFGCECTGDQCRGRSRYMHGDFGYSDCIGRDDLYLVAGRRVVGYNRCNRHGNSNGYDHLHHYRNNYRMQRDGYNNCHREWFTGHQCRCRCSYLHRVFHDFNSDRWNDLHLVAGNRIVGYYWCNCYG